MKSIFQDPEFPDTKQAKLPWRPSIRLYLILMNIILLFFLFPSVSYLFLKEIAAFRDVQLERTINQMRQNLESRGGSLARSMALSAGQAVSGYDFSFLNIMLHQVVADDPEIIYCIIMDTGGKAVAHSDPQKLGSVLSGQNDKEAISILKNEFPLLTTQGEHLSNVRFIDGVAKSEETGRKKIAVMEAIAPVYSGARLWGVLRCGYTLESLNSRIVSTQQEWAVKMEQFKFYFLTMTGVFFSLGVLVATLFTRSLLRSMKILNAGVTRLHEGDLEHQIEQKGMACAEFMNLSMAFNAMTRELRESYRQLGEYSRSLEQKVKERTSALREAQANLMKQAHEAGMAEMAVGVLHNIGNAITPAKVSIALLLKKINQSPIRAHLHDLIDQLRGVVVKPDEHSDEDKGRLLKIIELLPEGIQEEYASTANELEKIRDKHDYIESIIRLQMRYAQVYGDSDEVDVNQVAEDALHVLEETIHKRSVNVIKDFTRTPLIRFERAKLIQILVNLIKNGFEAMREIPLEERQLEISSRFDQGPPELVILKIKDNGCGFSSEEKKKLFTFGYTTKAKGSGFGLHSCANYVIANKGSIEAHSEGKGKGAEFILRLPVGSINAGDAVEG